MSESQNSPTQSPGPGSPLPVTGDPDATRAMNESPQVAIILDQYLDDLQNGRACSRDALLAEHTEFADELSEYLDGLEMVSGLGVGSELVPGQMGEFEIVRAVGRGAMGVVYEARQVALGRTVALKILRYTNAGGESIKRFEREAELIASLNHPNIVPIYSVGQHENQRYFAMQLIKGESLSHWSAEDAQRDPKIIAQWGAQIASALDHAHQHGVVHRDVKPSNILKQDETVWLTDFGLARRFDDVRMSMTGAMLGTPNYMSPEQAAPQRHPIDHRTDIYSLGASLFELLTGRCVFLAETPHGALAQVLTEEAPELSQLLPGVSLDLETILMKCLQKEPRDRYQTARELGDDLIAFSEGRSIKARRPSMLERFSRWKFQNEKSVRWATTAVISALTLLVLAASVWISWRNSNLASVKLNCDDGIAVGRLIDGDGHSSESFTIPMQNWRKIQPGDYELQLWGNGKIGESRKLSLDPGTWMETSIELREFGVFPDRTIQGIPQKIVVRNGDTVRHDFAILGRNGIDRIDGRTGELLWSMPSDDLLGKGVDWDWDWDGFAQLSKNDPRIPTVNESFPDVTGDGVDEVLLTMNRQNLQIVIDGSTGKQVWYYIPEIPEGMTSAARQRGTLYTPTNVGDIDGDGIEDFASLFYAGTTGKILAKWMDVVSSKTGEKIWRKEFPKAFFDKANVAFAPRGCQFNFQSPAMRMQQVQVSLLNHAVRNCDLIGTIPFDAVAPWPMHLICPSGDQERLAEAVLVCGSHVVSVRIEDGKPGRFNGGQPIDLGFFPAVAPRIVVSQDGSARLLVAEQIAVPNSMARVNGKTQFSLWSLETGKKLWEYDAASDATWLALEPSWPVVSDITGDGQPEILIADRADLGTPVISGASCQGSIQALDIETGKPIWDPQDVPMICSQDRQVQYLLTGPDADGDRSPDVYVVSPVAAHDEAAFIYIDVLAGKTGRKIRTVETSFPFAVKTELGIHLERPFFWGQAPDGSPQLVVADTNVYGLNSRSSTLVISTGTGKIVKSGYQLESPTLADGNGDGKLDLFCFRPRGQLIVDGGRIVSIKAASLESKQQLGLKLEPTVDLDGDGIRDFICSPQGQSKTMRMVSGRTGNKLWDYKFSNRNHWLFPLEHDFDNDGVNDVLGKENSFKGARAFAWLHLISGKTGERIWKQQGSGDGNFSARAADVDQDGNMEILVIQRKDMDFGKTMMLNSAWIYLDCYSGAKGDLRWSSELTPQGVPQELFGVNLDRWVIEMVETNKGLMVVAPSYGSKMKQGYTAFHAKDGSPVWTQTTNLIDGMNCGELCRIGFVEGDNKAAGLAQTSPVVARLDFQLAKSRAEVTWLDSATGEEISKWSGAGNALAMNEVVSLEHPAGYGCPFEINDGDVCYTGVCIYGPTSDASRLTYKIMVFDHSQKEATLIKNLEIPYPRSAFAHPPSRHLFLLLDPDPKTDLKTDPKTDSGETAAQTLNTQILTCAEDKLQIKELVTGKIVRERDWEADGLQLEPLHLDRLKRQVSVIATQENESRVFVLDLESLQTLWKIDIPKLPSSSYLTKYIQPLNEGNTIPAFLISGENQVVIHGRSSDYLGDDSEIRTAWEAGVSNSVAGNFAGNFADNFAGNFADEFAGNFAGIQGRDPRLVVRAPWAVDYSFWNDGGLLWEVLGRVVIALAVFVFPLLYLRHWFRHGQLRISLRTFLALPLLFAIPFLVLSLPIKTHSFGVNDIFHSKIAMAIYVLPTLVFLYFVFKLLLARRWWSGFGVFFATMLVALTIVSLQLIVEKIPEGAYFNFYDLGALGVLIPAINVVGFLLMVGWSIRGFVLLVPKLIGRKNQAGDLNPV